MDDFFRYSDSAHDSIRTAGRPYNEDGAYPDELDCDAVTDLCASCGEEIASNSSDSIIVDSDGWIFCCLDCQCEFNSARLINEEV